MSQVYFAGDLHLDHKNIANFRPQFNSMEEHNEIVMDNILSTVTKRDKLYLMGDIAFSLDALEMIKRIPCQKVLVAGNHCYISGTELLTAEGWKEVSEITTQDMVASVNLNDNVMCFETPSRTVVNECSETYTVKGKWIDEEVSAGHNIVLDGQLTCVSEAVGIYDRSQFSYSALAENKGIDLTDDWIRLLTWVVMDATLVRSSERKTRVQFKLSKERKIIMLEELLNKMGIPYTKRLCKKTGINKLQPYYIRIYGKTSLGIHAMLDDNKQLPSEWRNMTRHQLEVFLSVLEKTDGHRTCNIISWASVSDNDVDIVQEACARNGFCMKVDKKLPKSGFRNGKLQNICAIASVIPNASNHKVVVSKSGREAKTYGVTTSNGTVVCRRNGKVSISGNCTERGITMKHLIDVYDSIYALTQYKGYWLSHCPIHPQEIRGRKGVIHGHLHYNNIDDGRYVNVSLEQIDYKPIKFEEVVERFYD